MKDIAAPLLDQSRLRASFRRGLETYHKDATAQARIARRLAELLRQAGAPQYFGEAFEFGCGTGLLTEELLAHHSFGQLTLNDLVPEAARGQVVPGCGEARFVSGPVETAPLPQGLDLIASASTVQWVADLPALLERLTAHLAPGGWLALSGFGRGQFCELQALRSSGEAPSYADAEDWPAMMPPGLELVKLEQSAQVLEFSSALDLLRHLRRTGVNARAGGQWSRARLAAFENDYRSRFGRNGQLPLTYDAVWVLARKC